MGDFASPFNLRRHLKVHNEIEKPLRSKKDFKCDTKIFKRKKTIQIGDENPHKCEICDKSYHNRNNLLRHMKSHKDSNEVLESTAA